MGRYCDELNDMKDSGTLSTVIHDIIGDERYQDSWFTLTYDEVQRVLFGLGERLDKMQAIQNGALSYHDVHIKSMGYAKMEQIMRWWYDNKDGELIFA